MNSIDLKFSTIRTYVIIFVIVLTSSSTNAAWLVKDNLLIDMARQLARESTLKDFRDKFNTKTDTVITKLNDIKNVLDKTYKRDTLSAVSALNSTITMVATANTLDYSEIKCPAVTLVYHVLDQKIYDSCEKVNTTANAIFSETKKLYGSLKVIQNKLNKYSVAVTTDPGKLASWSFELQILQASQANLIGMHMATLELYKLNLEVAKYNYLQLSLRKVTS